MNFDPNPRSIAPTSAPAASTAKAVPSAGGEAPPLAATSPRFWRSLEELAGDEQALAALGHEFPEYADRLTDEPSRRQFLQLMGASLALAGVQGCVQQPTETIVPYVRAPEQLVPGQPLYYATAMTLDGASVGLLGETHMGRPTKVEGNPLHPGVPEVMAAASDGRMRLGATDAFSQAVVLSLYDPDRSQTVSRDGQISTWEAFLGELRGQIERVQPAGGRGLRVLSESVISPTLADQLDQFLAASPEARWHQYEPLHDDQAVAGRRLAFGDDRSAIYHFEQADIILSLDADFLSEGADHLAHARAVANRRRVDRAGQADAPAMNRLYVVETSLSLTGAAADHRLSFGPGGVAAFAATVAAELGLEIGPIERPAGEWYAGHWLAALLEDLNAARGRSLVIAGRSQPPAVHALAHWLNETLGNVGNTVEYREPIEARPERHVESLRELVESIRRGEVQSLVILGGNPAYDAPADLDFAAALAEVPFTAHLSVYENETSRRCQWHVPAAHLLERWSDTRAADGTASIVQPLIAPLYRGKTVHEMVAALMGTPHQSGHDIVREYWQQRHAQAGSPVDFETFWQTALHDGVVAGTDSPPADARVTAANLPAAISDALAATAARPARGGTELRLGFRPDPSVWDGRFANNGWLQELPRPFTKLTWDNAALVSPRLAEEQGIETGDVLRIAVGTASIEIPACVTPGQPRNTITLHVGYGRDRAGRIGHRVGTDVYPLRTSGEMWFAGVTSLRKTGDRYEFARTQHHHWMDGRDLVRAGTFEEYQAHPEEPIFMRAGHDTNPQTSMYPEFAYTGYKWGMVVDQSACTGCNACVVACQAENNIPIVGRDQVARGREMHWLRIDQYYEGDSHDQPSGGERAPQVSRPLAVYNQPVLCMHCELAPCEPVCPVAATTHSSEGLNEMVYNRCVGTRYCSNNCPYKVRRFNFLEYNSELKQDAVLQMLPNPDVTVRSRGVMEKCTYCVQRISAARITAEKQNRSIRDGEVITACQAACPAEAIIFGDLNDPHSRVARAASGSLNYALLGDLNTRPRTTYGAVVRNPHPSLAPTRELADEPAH